MTFVGNLGFGELVVDPGISARPFFHQFSIIEVGERHLWRLLYDDISTRYTRPCKATSLIWFNVEHFYHTFFEWEMDWVSPTPTS